MFHFSIYHQTYPGLRIILCSNSRLLFEQTAIISQNIFQTSLTDNLSAEKLTTQRLLNQRSLPLELGKQPPQ